MDPKTSTVESEPSEFDPSAKVKAGWRALLPEDLSESAGVAAKVAFAKAGMKGAGETSAIFAGGAPGASTRAEASKVIREAKKAAINHYSNPENLAELGAKLTVLMSDYGVGDARRLSSAKLKEVEAGLAFGDEGEKAVYTKMMIEIYNGALGNLKKAADKSGDRSFLKSGAGELKEALVPVELEEAYESATKRDKKYVWALETDRDGRSRVVRKNASTVRDWLNKTADGVAAGENAEEGIGYFLGSSAKALFRLLPGMGEVEGKSQLRAEAARLYQQVEALIPGRKGNIHPHGQPVEGAEKSDPNEHGSDKNREDRGLIVPSGVGVRPRMSEVGERSREARHAGR